MTNYNLAKNAYSSPTLAIRTPRNTEYEAFSRVTGMLKAADQDPLANFVKLATALHENSKLWTMIASSVAESENKLSKELRARLFYLAEFTKFHTSKILRKEASAQPLIEINSSIMAGLQGNEAKK